VSALKSPAVGDETEAGLKSSPSWRTNSTWHYGEATVKILQHEEAPSTERRERAEKSDGLLVKQLADAIRRERYFARDVGGKLCVFDDGVYLPEGDELIKRGVKRELESRRDIRFWSPRLAANVIEFIRIDAPRLWEVPPLDVLNVKNGLLRLSDRVLLPHDPSHLSSVQLPVLYDPSATCPQVEAFVSQVFPADAHDLAWQIPAWLMRPVTYIQKAVLLAGEGGCGKSTWLAMLRAFIGTDNTSSMRLHDIETNRFAVASLVGKLANICADIPTTTLSSAHVFKTLTGDDKTMIGERKFCENFEFKPFVRLVFSANRLPQSEDTTAAFFERWVVIPFANKFRGQTNEKSRDVLDARLAAPAELSGLLNKALDALPAIDRGRLTLPPSVISACQDFRGSSDPLAVWLDRNTIDGPNELVPRQQLFLAYNAHLERKELPRLKEQAFGMALKKLRPNVDSAQPRISGKPTRCYTGISLVRPTAHDTTPASRDGFPGGGTNLELRPAA